MLLDTRVLLWLLADNPSLGESARRLLAAEGSLVASTVSLWEIAIKSDLGKLMVPEDFPHRVSASGIEWLALSPDHVWAGREVSGMPHRDPFDRMLIAVSHILDVPMMTADRALLTAEASPAIRLIDARE